MRRTPNDLIRDGLYGALAVAWHPMPFRDVSYVLTAKALGAVHENCIRRLYKSLRQMCHSKRRAATSTTANAASEEASAGTNGDVDMASSIVELAIPQDAVAPADNERLKLYRERLPPRAEDSESSERGCAVAISSSIAASV